MIEIIIKKEFQNKNNNKVLIELGSMIVNETHVIINYLFTIFQNLLYSR